MALVVAVGISINPTLTFSKEDKTILENKGIQSPQILEEGCDDEYCVFVLRSKNTTLRRFRIDSSKSDYEIELLVEEKIKEVLENIIEVEKSLDRKKRFEDGDVTISERK